MMAFGDAFPPQIVCASIKRQLKPRAVIKFISKMDDGQAHEKRFVVLLVSDDILTCVINSEISMFIKQRPDMLRCQVLIDQHGHQFMSRDSHIDCSRVRRYRVDDVVNQLIKCPDWVLGEISDSIVDGVCSALKYSPLISPKEVEDICNSLV